MKKKYNSNQNGWDKVQKLRPTIGCFTINIDYHVGEG